MVKYLVTAMIIGGLTSPAIANEITGELDEVVVSASRVQEKLKDTPTTVNIISEKEVEQVKFRNPEEILKRIPGIYSHDFGGESELTSIRIPTHFTNPYTLVLVDGLPIASYGSGSSSKFREIGSDNIERIEIVKGPASAIYGSNAIGGVINIITKNPSPTPKTKAWIEYGDYSQYRGGVSSSGSNEKVGYNIDLHMTDAEGWRDHTEHDKKSANVKLQFPGESSLFKVQFDYVDFDHDSGGTLSKTDFDLDWQHSYHTFAKSTMEKFSPTVSYSKYFDTSELTATLALRDFDHEVYPNYGIYKRGPVYVGSHSIIDGQDVDLQVLYNYEFSKMGGKIITGLDMERGNTETDKYGLTISWDAATKTYDSYTEGAMTDDLDVTTTMAAPYIQAEFSPMNDLRVVAGARYDTAEYDVKDHLGNGKGGSKDFSKVTPKLGVSYDISPSINSFVSFSQGFVVPTASQLFTSRYATPDLKPEKATNYEIGLRGTLLDNKVSLNMALYAMAIEDKIITNTISTVPFTVEQYVNAGKATQRGVELSSSFLPLDYLQVDITYTYARNEYDDYVDAGSGVDYSGNTAPRSPDHHFVGRLTLMPMDNLNCELEVDAVSEEYIDDGNLFTYSRPVLVNFRANYDWKDFSFWGHIKNLTDQEYATYTSYGSTGASYYSGSPRTFFAGISYTWK